jgi:hypothetical protein
MSRWCYRRAVGRTVVYSQHIEGIGSTALIHEHAKHHEYTKQLQMMQFLLRERVINARTRIMHVCMNIA